MGKNLLILGAGGHGKVAADIALKLNQWDHIFFLDDNEKKDCPLGLQVIGKVADSNKYISDYDLFIGIGSNHVREKLQEELTANGASFPALIHPSAIIGKQVEIGAGTAVMAGAIINCCTTIEAGCIVNTGATIDHDSYIEAYSHISPGAHLAGTVKVGRKTWLGIGTIVSNNVTITSDCITGAGTVVIRDIDAAGTYVGVPSRRV